MSATNSTANYGLPIFLGSDVPSWLTDWNGAMGDIDTAIAAAKAVADSALLASGNNTSDITTIQGQITTLQTTVGTHTTQIGTISGNINTINSLIGNGTPTTTDQTLIGAINELHANQGDLANLTTTDKTSLVAAINEAAQGGGGSPAASAVSYDNTGSGLTATNVQDAIDEVASSIGSESISVTADGVKTLGALLDELYASIDRTKLTKNSVIELPRTSGNTEYYHLAEVRTAELYFGMVSRYYSMGIEVKASTSVASSYSWGGTVTQFESEVTPSASDIILYY